MICYVYYFLGNLHTYIVLVMFLGYKILIPSRLMDPNVKLACEKASCSQESCLLWPKPYIQTGLSDKHMPFVMFSVASVLRWVHNF